MKELIYKVSFFKKHIVIEPDLSITDFGDNGAYVILKMDNKRALLFAKMILKKVK